MAKATEKKSPSVLDFCKAVNDPSVKTKADVLALLEERGFTVNYASVVSRYNSYTDADRLGGPIRLKTLEASPRGRRIDSSDINRQLAELGLLPDDNGVVKGTKKKAAKK